LLELLEEELGQYHQAHGKTYEEVSRQSRLQYNHMQADKELNPQHIDYIIPVNDVQKQRLYSQFIARECILRGIPLDGELEDWRSALTACVDNEKAIAILKKVREWKE
ncbi:MAG: hypothetical protein ACK53Y_23235, partial [bacterium]